MNVVSPHQLIEFASRHPLAGPTLNRWLHVMQTADFASSHELRARFPAASFLGAGLTVFNIGGNKYRLVARVHYPSKSVRIRHVLTHAQYDRRSSRGEL